MHGHGNASAKKNSIVKVVRERQGKNKEVIYRLWSVRIVKNCDLGLENAARSTPNGPITYMYSGSHYIR